MYKQTNAIQDLWAIDDADGRRLLFAISDALLMLYQPQDSHYLR